MQVGQVQHFEGLEVIYLAVKVALFLDNTV
jgi:hypothetical protein